jgi:hypothetical protein
MAYKRVEVRTNRNRLDGVVYMYDNYYDYLDFIEEGMDEINKYPRSNAFSVKNDYFNDRYLQRMSQRQSWFGTTNLDEVTSEIRSFLMNDELSQETNNIKTNTAPQIDFDLEQKKQLEFTSQEIGIFSFDLASLGLIRVYEYYSPLLKRNVDANYVKSYKVDNNKLIFYHVYVAEIPEHILEQRSGKLFSTLLNVYIDKDQAQVRTSKDGSIYFVHPFQAEIPKHDIERRQVRNSDGTLKFSSTWKKSFIYIPVQENYIPQLELFFVTSFSSGQDARNNLFWNSVLMNAVLDLLSTANVRFRVFAGIGNQWRNNEYNLGFVKIKDINDALDPNIVAILSGDARNYRYNGFKWYLASGWESELDSAIRSSFGTIVTDEAILKTALIETLKQTKDFGSSEEDTINPRTKILIPPVKNEQEARDALLSVINQIQGVSNQTPPTP